MAFENLFPLSLAHQHLSGLACAACSTRDPIYRPLDSKPTQPELGVERLKIIRGLSFCSPANTAGEQTRWCVLPFTQATYPVCEE